MNGIFLSGKYVMLLSVFLRKVAFYHPRNSKIIFEKEMWSWSTFQIWKKIIFYHTWYDFPKLNILPFVVIIILPN